MNKITLAVILACNSGLLMAEEVVVAPSEQAHAGVEDVTELRPVQIRAKAADLAVVPANVPNTVEGVSAKQISESINAVTTPQVLQYLPSVHVRERYIGDVNGVLVMRVNSSTSSAQTTVYADDLLISNFLNNSFSTAPRWLMVSPEEIDRVDVMYGPFSALYPGNSAGGVVVMKTRMPEKFEAHAKFDYFGENFKLYGTDKYYDGVHGAASIGSKFNDFSFIVNADHLDNHAHPMTFTAATAKTGAAAAAGQFTVVNGAYNDIDTSGNPRVTTAAASIDHTVQDNLKIKLAYDITPSIRVAYTLGYWQNDSEKRGESFLTNAAGNTIYGSTTTAGLFRYLRINGKDYSVTAPASSNTESEHVMHGLSLKSDTGGTWDWGVVASYFNQGKDLTRSSTGNFGLNASDGATVVGGTIADASGTGWKGLDLRGDWRPSGDLKSEHQVSFGYHYDNYETKTDTYGVVTGADWRTGAKGVLNTNSRGATQTQALYLQDAWQLNQALKLVVGGRWEKWNAFNGSNYAAGTNVTYGDRTIYAFSPKASLTFQATDDWSLRGSYGEGVRFPTVGELFTNLGITDAAGGTLTALQIATLPAPYNLAKTNDPSLKPERVNSFELTIEKLFARGMWRNSFFYEDKEDALISQSDYTTLPSYRINSVQNVDKVRTYGMESSLQIKDLLVDGFDLSGSVTCIDSTITKNSKNLGLEGTDQPRIPDFRATLMGVYRANDKLTLSLASRYSGRQHNSLYDTVNKKYTDVNPNVYGAVSHYFVVDAKATYKVADQWSAALGVNNLNNFKYYVNPNPYPQRTWFATMKFDY
ncbi:MAG: TonB-dependent receptor [Methylotenera sp.]|nr:TonB-dependent receptor [Methylotenera sp.]